MRGTLAATVLVSAVVTLTACGGGKEQEQQTAPPPATEPPQRADVCSNEDGVLGGSAFVFVTSPRSGERVASGFRVTGCSNTFEATVAWRLRARDGRELASGFTQGGTLDEPGPFTFTVEYSVGGSQVGHLEVFMPPVTEEGFPPPKDVVPLVLQP